MRKYLIGVIAGLAGAMAFSSVALADVTALTITGNVTPSKQDKKVRGGASVFFQSADTHAGALPCTPPVNTLACRAFPPSIQSVITFPTDYRFDPGTLPDCNLGSLVGKGTAAARSTCPRSVVGTGANVQLFSDGRTLNGTVTAFNGAPSGGLPTQYIHVEFPGVESKPILNGPINRNVITLQIPPVGGSVIENIGVTFPRTVTKKTKDKKTGKVKKTFYFAAKCSTGTWTTREVNTFQGGKTLTATSTQRCTKKK